MYKKKHLIIATAIYILAFAGLIWFAMYSLDKRELNRSAKAVLETPNLTGCKCDCDCMLPPLN